MIGKSKFDDSRYIYAYRFIKITFTMEVHLFQ